MSISNRVMRVELCAVAFGLLFAGDGWAQVGKGGLKRDPVIKNPFLQKKDKDKDTTSGGDSTTAKSIDGVIDLGQRATATLPAPGSIVTVDFYAPKGATFSLTITCSGEIGDSEARIKYPLLVLSEVFRKTGKKFELLEHEVKSTGLHTVSFAHRGEGELGYTLTTTVKYPKTFEEPLVFATGTEATIKVPGLVGRRVSEVAAVPTIPNSSYPIALKIRDPRGDEIATYRSDTVSVEKPKIPLPRPESLAEEQEYTFAFELAKDAPVDTWKARISFLNPPPATGTVKLEAK